METSLGGYFFGGVPYPIFLHESFSYDLIRFHPEFHCPRSSGSALKVCGGGVGGYTNNHYHSSVELS